MSANASASPGAMGGSNNELGSEFRGRVGALLGTAVLRGAPLQDVGLPISGAKAITLQVESDDPVDDLVVTLADGSRIFVQAKRSATLDRGKDKPLDSALKQFARALRSGDLNAHDHLVLACAHPSDSLLHLATLLERRRHPKQGAPSTKEAKALESFTRRAATHLSPPMVERLLDVLTVWRTDPTSGDGEGLLAARLDGHVVEPGGGLAAARHLTDVVRKLAQLRAGDDAVLLAQALASRGCSLTIDAPATSPMAWAAALMTHRNRAVTRGTTLELFGAPPEMSGLPLDDADAGVDISASTMETYLGSYPVELAVRRYGRVLLVGRPGGGKSTALRAAAAFYADRPSWPVPILVHLQRLTPRKGGLRDALLDVACDEDDLGDGERKALRAGLAHELAKGRALLLLDGLDEVRRGRAALVNDLARMLTNVPKEIELVVATRPVGVADARPLGLVRLHLSSPGSPWRTVQTILRASAPKTNREAWVEVRETWVMEVLRTQRALRQTPLTVVILALIAARSDSIDALPTTRAAVLQRTLTDVIDTWEIQRRHRGDVTIGPLDHTRARHALVVALRCLSTATLAEEPPAESEVTLLVRDAIAESFSLRSGDAHATAEDAIAFWVDAGLFSFPGDQPAATIRQLAELGTGWDLSKLDQPEQVHWVDGARRTPDLWPSLTLAAALTPRVAEHWAEGVAGTGTADELIELIDAIHEGAHLAPEALVAMAEAVAARFVPDAKDGERVVEALVSLPIPDGARARLRPLLIEPLAPTRQAMAEAMVIVGFDEQGPQADDFLRAFIHTSSSRYDAIFDDVRDRAALRVAGLSRDDAVMVTDLARSSPHSQLARNLEEVLERAGHADLVALLHDRPSESEPSLGTPEPVIDPPEPIDVATVVAELAEPAPLTQIQARRLDELCELLASRLLWTVYDPESSRSDALPKAAWVRLVAELSGHDLGVLAAQALVVLSDVPDLDAGTAWLVDGRTAAPRLDHWDVVTDVDHALAALVAAIDPQRRDCVETLTIALAAAPDHRHTVALLDTRLDDSTLQARTLTAQILLDVLRAVPGDGLAMADARARQWLDHDDPMLRRAAAAWWGKRIAASGEGAGEFERCLGDPETGVRIAAIEPLDRESITDPLRERLKLLVAQTKEEKRAGRPSPIWVCEICGVEQAPAYYHDYWCVSCRADRDGIVDMVEGILRDQSVGWSYPDIDINDLGINLDALDTSDDFGWDDDRRDLRRVGEDKGRRWR